MAGTSGGRAEELTVFWRGGGTGRLDGNTGEQELGGTIGDTGEAGDSGINRGIRGFWLDGTNGGRRNRELISSL